jgi:anhydro-N-acetylmuramic acid kinase
MPSYIGLISGTSMDGVDAALVSFESDAFIVHATRTTEYPTALREQLIEAIRPGARLSLHEFGSLDVTVGGIFAQAAREIMGECDIDRAGIVAIGSHGQTLRHSPDSAPPYTIQIGDPATITNACGLPTVADFRSLDIAAGGQGAPLVPPFHEAYFRNAPANTVVLNIGGIANLTILPGDPEQPLLGFDTGPGNCLLDEWIGLHRQQKFDHDGNWARTGTIVPALLRTMMANPYISRAPPKSTGREYFNLAWLRTALEEARANDLQPEDVQATLLAYTVESVACGIEQVAAAPERVLVCGGGARNGRIIDSLRARLRGVSVDSIDAVGANPDSIEAVAFAWLARQRMNETPVRLTTATAVTERILGAVYLPSNG